jgi:hypothetical protein
MEKIVPWMTFALVHPHWHLPTEIELPFYFSDSVSYRAIPDWVIKETGNDELKRQIKAAIDDGISHCIAVEYSAAHLGYADPNWRGQGKRAIQVAAVEQIRFVNFALWLARPTQFGFRTVIHADKYSDEWVIRQIVT